MTNRRPKSRHVHSHTVVVRPADEAWGVTAATFSRVCECGHIAEWRMATEAEAAKS